MDHGTISILAALAIILGVVLLRQQRRLECAEHQIRNLWRLRDEEATPSAEIIGDDSNSSDSSSVSDIEAAEWWRTGDPNPYRTEE